MNNIIEQLRVNAIEKSKAYPDEYFFIRGVWRIDHHYQPNAWERSLAYSMLIVQTIWQGCCYCNYGSVNVDESLLGKDAREVRTRDIGVDIATLDAIYSVFEKKPEASYVFEGSSNDKAIRRAQIIVDQVERELGKKRCKVLNVGVMGNFIKQLRNRGVDVIAADFDPALIGQRINGVYVESGEKTLDLIKECDLVLATGMTRTTQTLGAIISTVKRHNKKVVLFAATGAHFAEEYCKTFGVNLVISEPQPQYLFQGRSIINIYRMKVD